VALVRKRGNRRRVEDAPRWRLPALPALPWPRIGLGAAAGAALLLFGWLLLRLLDQPIERVTVAGSFQRITAPEVEKAVRAELRGAGLVSVDLARVSRALRRLPWVDGASVQRSWPRGLAVRVVEQVAVARWNAADLLNARGERFLAAARFVPPELPQLSGPEGTEAEVVAHYLAAQGRVVEAGMHLAALRLDARGAWELTLDNGVRVRLGRQRYDERFERFASAALRLVAQRAADIDYVDMRYTNGFAVGWRAGSTRLAGRAAEATNPDG
jgi:cell division protein FtsQ